MLLLITGASGVGKSTTRFAIANELDDVESIELWHLGPIPAIPTVAWRQELVEQVVQRAIALDTEGRHLLFAGDPVAAGEALAAPSSDRVDIAVCLLHANEEAQTTRLRAAGHSDGLLFNNLGYANWMRHHATDPSFVHEALTNNSWPAMRCERWSGLENGDPRWAMTVIDTSNLAKEEVAAWALHGFGMRSRARLRCSERAGSSS